MADDVRLRPTTVRARTTIAAAFVVGAALAATGVLVVHTVHGRLVRGQRNTAELRASDVAVLVADGHLPPTLAIPGEDRALVQVVDGRGRVLVQSTNTANRSSILTAAELGKAPFVTTMRGLPIGDSERFVVVAVPATTATGIVTVITAESLESADDDASAVTRLLLLGIPLIVGLVTLIVLRTTQSAFDPVNKMTVELGEISSNDLHRRVSLPTSDNEIGQLGAAMNLLLERLERSSDRERQFVADASHELRSPLASIRAALEIADTHPDKIDPHIAISDALADHVRLDRLVDDLLALARLDGTHLVDVEAVDFALLATADLAGRTDSIIQVARTLGPAIVVGDETQLGRALRNLIDNALRHARSDVRVQTSAVGDRAIITVDDDGPGIPVAERGFVFERFSRRDNARAADDGGSGLGLAIVREVIEAHRGKVEVTDGPLGGARFLISMPTASSVLGRNHFEETSVSRFRRRSLRLGLGRTTTQKAKSGPVKDA